MTPKALNQLRDAIGVWSTNQDPVLSVIEDTGIIALCIRYPNDKILSSAIGGIGIHTLTFCANEKVSITEIYTKLMYDNPREALKSLVLHTHICLLPDRDKEELKFAVQYIFESLCCLSKLMLKREYFEILMENWNQIRKP